MVSRQRRKLPAYCSSFTCGRTRSDAMRDSAVSNASSSSTLPALCRKISIPFRIFSWLFLPIPFSPLSLSSWAAFARSSTLTMSSSW